MMPSKKILKYAVVYLACVGFIAAGGYIAITYYAQKTLYLDKKQWHPAEPQTERIDPVRLDLALEYVRTRLPTARSVLVLRNGKTVAEKYYWRGGPEETDYLHSLNLPLLQVLIGIAIDRQMIRGPEQPLFDFFPRQFSGTQFDNQASLKLSHLLNAQAPLLWGNGSSDYWDLFYAMDRSKAGLQAVYRHQTKDYSAINFASAYLLGRVIEQVSGQSLIDFADQYLLQPLGITTYADGNKLSRDPLVGFQLKPLDLAKIGYLLLREGAWQGRQILSKEWIHCLFSKAPLSELDDIPGGSWVKSIIRGYESLLGVGEGGQYLVLIPALQMVVVTTSTSTFALPKENGHDRLLQLIIESVLPRPPANDMSASQRQKPETAPREYTDALAPNYVSSTPVPREILNFFHQFADDIVSKDKRRLAANYARIYDFGEPPLFSRNWSSARLMLSPVPPLLEYVYITKIRIEKNRAYLRGNVKFDYRTFAGSQGIFPLENLIKLKGRWKWLGLPEKTAILDRDDYFDSELNEAHQRFMDDCSDSLLGESELSDNDCVANSFQSAERGQNLLAERLHPLLKGRSGLKLHVTAIQKNGVAYHVQGYVEGSVLGDLRLPNDLYIVKENGDWKWQIGGLGQMLSKSQERI